jgi:indole-3-glycerol phosphate synthase
MTILEDIIANKKKEVEENKERKPVNQLEKSIYFNKPVHSLKKSLLDPEKAGIIAEFKRKSPSKGIINNHLSVENTTVAYVQAGASALSVLTDTKFFGGSNEDLATARGLNTGPILRKDFTIDEYQVMEAKAIGADVILLIAAALSPDRIYALSRLAASLGLEVLLEVKEKGEIAASLNEFISVIGVNNRNLHDFSVDLNRSLKLLDYLPKDMVKISESGIYTAKDIIMLREAGYLGFLIGERFMQTGNPGQACAGLIREIMQ